MLTPPNVEHLGVKPAGNPEFPSKMLNPEGVSILGGCEHLRSAPQGAALAALLLDLARAGWQLARDPADPGGLIVTEAPRGNPVGGGAESSTAPAEGAKTQTAARLRLHRAALVALLASGYSPAEGTEAAHRYAERLGVADDLEMPTRPGSVAWLLAVGESIQKGDLTS